MHINGNTEIIAHIGYPTHSFKAPMIYNPYFASRGLNVVVVPMAVGADDFESVIQSVFKMKNVRGALITMPHKVSVLNLADQVMTTAAVAGAANALKRDQNGALVADMFDGAGFVRGIENKGFVCAGKKCLLVGSGGVGSAIAASLAKAGVAELALFDVNPSAALALAGRIRTHYPATKARAAPNDPSEFDLVVNCSPLGMNANDPLPFDVAKLSSNTFVGEVVMASEITPLLAAAKARGCNYQIGTDMLFEMIPAYLEFFGFQSASAADLRAVAQLKYA